MKRIAIIGVLFFFGLVGIATAQVTGVFKGRLGPAPGAGGGGCVASTTLKVDTIPCTSGCAGEGVAAGGDGYETRQGLNITSSITICKVDVEVFCDSANCAWHLFFTDSSVAGTQIGGNSDTINMTQDTGYQVRSFIWSSNLPNPSADAWLKIYRESGVGYVRVRTTATAYDSTTYFISYQGTDFTSEDMVFKIYVSQ